MKLDLITSKNDEFYTPAYAVEPILEFVKMGGVKCTVWCPFDTEQSHFVTMLREIGCKVIHTHMSYGQDFFETEPDEHYDCIISNPPYSKKNEVFQRLFELGKPFAMLVGLVGLFESQKRFHMFKDNNFELMILNKRVAFFKNYDDEKTEMNPPFSTGYITRNMLPEKIIFREINKV
jgi:hypothetical protein